MWLAATNGFSPGSGLGTHCNRKRRLNAAVLRARLLLSPHSSHLDSAKKGLWALANVRREARKSLSLRG